MKIIDVNGNPHDLTQMQVNVMLIIGWTAFLLSWVMHILYYKTHPSSVDFSLPRFRERCFVYVLGKKEHLCCYKGK